MAQLKLKQLDSVLTGSLQVSGSAGVTGSLSVGGTLFGPADDHFDIKSDKDVRLYLDKDNDGSFHKLQVFNEDGDVKFAIASDGKSAIGAAVTSNSLDGLSVTGGITATGNVTASGNISSSGEITGSGIYSDGPISILDSGPSTPNAKILINSSNNNLNIGDTIVVTDGNNRVGMGDTAPSSPDTELHIKSDTPVITLQRTDNEDRGAIEFQGQGGTVGAHIEYVSDVNDLSFGTFDGSKVHEKLRLEDGATGNIKVSGSSQITGSLYVSGAYYGDGSQLSGITSGIFQQTGSIQATTNDLQITGSLVATGNITASGDIKAASLYVTSSGESVVQVGHSGTTLSKWEWHRDGERKWVIFNDGRANPFGGQDSLIFKHGVSSDGDDHINFYMKPDDQNVYFEGNVTASGALISETHVTASGNISSSGNITGSDIYASGKLYGDGSELTGISSGIFQQTGSFQATTADLQITGSLTASGTVTGENLYMAENLYHTDDTDTYIGFPTGDKVDIKAGGINFMRAWQKDSDVDKLYFGYNEDPIDYIFRTDQNNPGLKISGSGNIGMYGIGTPLANVHIGGNLLTNSHITASGNISSSANITGSNIYAAGAFYGDGSNLSNLPGGGIFIATGSSYNTTNNLEISGSLLISGSTLTVRTGTDSGPPTASTAIFTNNITNGYPTSNAWGEGLDGSYFNNFDNTSHVSEILRFMAGIISHSIDTSSPTANTKYWNTVSTSHTEGSTTSKGSLLNGVLGSTYENARLSQHWTSSAFIDMSETGSYRSVQDYLILKGWVLTSDRGDFGNDTGTNPFHGSYASRIPSTIQTQATLGTNSFTITANTGGSSAVYSNSNYFGMGPLSSGNAVPFYVRVLASQSFSDNYADSTPDQNSTFTTASVFDYSISSFGTSNGLVLAKIDSANPAVIPAAYQDGDFNSVAGTISGRKYTGGATSATSISASGYYATHDIDVGLKSGSQSDYVFKNGSDSNTRFYLYAGGLPSDITNSQPTAVVTSSAHISAFAATSRSLSGAPYLLTTAYTVLFESEVSKSFDPCYGYGTSVLVNSNTTDTWENIGSTTLSNTTCTVNNSGVSSTGANTYVIDSTKSTKRSSSGIPHRSDIAVVSSSLSFTLDSNTENVGQNRSSNNTLNYSLVFRARGRNWKNTAVDSSSGTIYLWDSSRFGQNSDSGSMAVYSRAQGYDSNTLQDTTETFTGEDFRIVLADNVQAFNGAYFTTDSFQTNDEGDSTLGRNDLQVKPGYLVDPTGSYGYWFTSDSLQESNAGYRYYIRRFQTDGGTKTSMTVNLNNTTLVAWNSTSNGIACALLFESSGNGSGNNSSLSTARIYDPTATTSNLIEADISQDYFKNPFSTAISLYGNSGGNISSGTYTVPIRNADGMYLDSNDNELYVIVRYKGDPTPIDDITLTFS